MLMILLHLQIGLLPKLWFVMKRSKILYWTIENEDLCRVNIRTIYCTEKALSTTEVMWTMECGTDLARWTVRFCPSAISVRITFFGHLPQRILHNAGTLFQVCITLFVAKQPSRGVSVSPDLSDSKTWRDTSCTPCHICHWCRIFRSSDGQYSRYRYRGIAKNHSWAACGFCSPLREREKSSTIARSPKNISWQVQWGYDCTWEGQKRVGCYRSCGIIPSITGGSGRSENVVASKKDSL